MKVLLLSDLHSLDVKVPSGGLTNPDRNYLPAYDHTGVAAPLLIIVLFYQRIMYNLCYVIPETIELNLIFLFNITSDYTKYIKKRCELMHLLVPVSGKV